MGSNLFQGTQLLIPIETFKIVIFHGARRVRTPPPSGSAHDVDLVTAGNVSFRHVPRQDQKQAGVFAANCENCGHFFKYRAVAPFKTSVTFTVNGVAYTGIAGRFGYCKGDTS